MDTFLGHTMEYWLELQKKAEELAVTDYIEEIAKLRGKVSFYESRIQQMVEMRDK
jgi:hypothetical protein